MIVSYVDQEAGKAENHNEFFTLEEVGLSLGKRNPHTPHPCETWLIEAG